MGDGSGDTNASLVMRTCRADGVILRPDRPAFPLRERRAKVAGREGRPGGAGRARGAGGAHQGGAAERVRRQVRGQAPVVHRQAVLAAPAEEAQTRERALLRPTEALRAGDAVRVTLSFRTPALLDDLDALANFWEHPDREEVLADWSTLARSICRREIKALQTALAK